MQDGRARYRGAEFSLTGELTRDLSVFAGAMFLSAKQGQTSDLNLIGKRIENTPKVQASLSAEYRFSSLLPGFSINGGVYYTGNRAINPANQLFIPNFTTVDFGGSFRTNIDGYDVTFRVYADNIFGERYFASTAGNFVAKSLPPAIKFNRQVNLF